MKKLIIFAITATATGAVTYAVKKNLFSRKEKGKQAKSPIGGHS